MGFLFFILKKTQEGSKIYNVISKSNSSVLESPPSPFTSHGLHIVLSEILILKVSSYLFI